MSRVPTDKEVKEMADRNIIIKNAQGTSEVELIKLGYAQGAKDMREFLKRLIR